MAKRTQTLSYQGILCDSFEEVYMLMYLFELQEKGLISDIERAPSFVLSQEVAEVYQEEVILKTKTKIVQKKKVLLKQHVYTPEFTVNIHGLDLFHHKDSKAYLEVKPVYDQNNMTRLFKINQKWMYQKFGIMVNLVTPEILFQQTFTPKKYLKTATGKQRKIKWKIKTIEDWLYEQGQG